MFLKYFKQKLSEGSVRIGLPAEGHGDVVTVDAGGFPGMLAGFLSQSDKAELSSIAREHAEKQVAEGRAALDDRYAREMKEREQAFQKQMPAEVCINIWDDYDDEADDTYAYIEEESPDSFNRACLEYLLQHLEERTDLTSSGVRCKLFFYDSAERYPNMVATEHQYCLFKRWEVRFSNLKHQRLETLVDELNEARLSFNDIRLRFISES